MKNRQKLTASPEAPGWLKPQIACIAGKSGISISRDQLARLAWGMLVANPCGQTSLEALLDQHGQPSRHNHSLPPGLRSSLAALDQFFKPASV